MKIHVIDIPMYEQRIYVLNNVEDDLFTAFFKKKFGAAPDRLLTSASAWIAKDKEDKQHYVIDFRKKLKKDLYSLNTIVHECLHVSIFIMQHLSIPLTYDTTDEVMCYLHSHIVEKVYEAVHKK